jgi:hypothetical protein
MAKIVTLVIDEEGNPSIDLAGYAGNGCQAVQDVFGRALGTTTKAVKKAEYTKPLTKNVCVKS